AGPLSGRIAPLGAARGDSALLSWGLGAVQDGKRVPAADSAVYDLGHSRWSPAGAVPPPRDTWCLDGPGCVGVDTGSRVVFAGQGGGGVDRPGVHRLGRGGRREPPGPVRRRRRLYPVMSRARRG